MTGTALIQLIGLSCSMYSGASVSQRKVHNLHFYIYSAPQQDVSEFTHKLLDWLEDAFQIKAEEDR